MKVLVKARAKIKEAIVVRKAHTVEGGISFRGKAANLHDGSVSVTQYIQGNINLY